MKDILNYLIAQNTLSLQEAKETLLKIGQGKYSEAEIAAFLMVFLMRKITPEELGGFREALLDLCVPIDIKEFNTIDVCGTGGDEKNTFNISTLSAFVLAGSGVKVAKHGNYAVSSACGSSNILEYFGYRFSSDENKLKKELETANICYMHAPLFHPAMKYVGPVRKSLGLKTFFNMLGPMVNPLRPQNQLIGVFNEEVMELYHQVYAQAGVNHTIIYSLNGYDEISLTGKFRVITEKEDKLFAPEDINLQQVLPEEIYGGETINEAASIFTSILEGKGSRAQHDVVVANAAFAMHCYYPDKNLKKCIEEVNETLRSGKAKEALNKLIKLQ